MATFSSNAFAKIAYRVFNFVVLISLSLSNLAIPKLTVNAADINPEENPSTKVDESSSTYSPPQYTHPQARTVSRPNEADLDSQSSIAECSGSSFMMFIENEGQFDSRERFEVKGSNGVVRATTDGILISLFETPTSIMTPTMSSQDEISSLRIAPTPQQTPSPESLNDGVTEGVNLKLSFEGANTDSSIIGFNRLETKVSFFIGNDPHNWRPDVPVWGGIRYLNIYDGYDLEITGDCGQWTWAINKNLTTSKDKDYLPSLKSDLTGSSTNNGEIRLKVQGSENLEVIGNNFNISTNMGEINFPLPQQRFSQSINQKPSQPQGSKDSRIDGNEIILPFTLTQVKVNGSFYQSPSSLNIQPTQSQETGKKPQSGLHFASLAPLNKNETIVNDFTYNQTISETLYFSTFLGGITGAMHEIAVDTQGNTYLNSEVHADEFPTEYGPYKVYAGNRDDVGIFKLDPTGSNLIYITIIGGSYDDYCYEGYLGIDSTNQVYVLGNTNSQDFPITINAYDSTYSNIESYIFKLDSTGTSLLYSSFLGGNDYEMAFGLNVVSPSEVYITGLSRSSNFPTTTNGYDLVLDGDEDAFVSIFNTTTSGTSSLVYSTFIGGDGIDKGQDIKVINNIIYLTGSTNSDDFPISNAYDPYHNGQKDEFVLALDPRTNDLIFSTFLGGSDDDCDNYFIGDFRQCEIAVTKNGIVYVTGVTISEDFPVYHAFDSIGESSEAYLAKFSNSGQLIFSTFIGGRLADVGFAISTDKSGLVYLTGYTHSSDFLVTNIGFDQSYNLNGDAFLSVWGPNGLPIYDTFLGGSNQDRGYGITINDTGTVYLVGHTYSSDFPLSSTAFESNLDDDWGDGFVTAFNLPYISIIAADQINNKCNLSNECEFGNPVQSTGTYGDPINTSTGQFFYNNQDISVPLPSQSLIFERYYSSFTTDTFTSTMGYGWTHSLDTRLILPDDPLGKEGYIRFKASSTNIYDFEENEDGTYDPTTGVVGVLSYTTTTPYTYTLVLPSQITYTFDEEGVLQMIENSTGQSTVYTYNQNDQLTRVGDENNARFLDLSYNEYGFVNNVTDYSSREITFTYNISDDLVSYVDVLGQTWQYEYDNNHNMTKIIDPDDNTITETEYDPSGRAIKQWDALGNQVVDITFNDNGSVTLENPIGDIQTDVYDGRGTLIGDVVGTGITTTKQYDRNFNPIKITDPAGQETQLEWSEDGVNLTNIEDAKGNSTEITYDSLNNPTEVVDALNHPTTYEYDGKLLTRTTDALGKVITYTYTEEGYLQSITNPLTQNTTYAYDEFGQRTAITNSLGITTTYEYDDLGRVINTTDALGRVSHTEYDNAGRVVKSVRNYDPLRPQNDDNQYNIVTTYAYDVRGNQIAVTDTYTNTTQYIYNDAGLLINTIDPLGHTITNTYNEAGQLITVTNALGDKTSYVYDEAGRQTSVTDALGHATHTVYNLDGTIANSIDPLGHEITYTYDNLDHLIATTDELNGVTTSEYDALGNVITSTNALGDITTYQYDALGRLIKQTDPLGGETEYFYDEVGNRIQTIDPRDHATTYSYDDAGRLVKVTDAFGNETHYEYDALGRQTAIIDDEGNRTEYTYDALDRVIAVTDPLTRTTTTQYDALGNVLSVTDANDKTTSYEYDDLYRQIRQTDALSGTISYTYDALGNRLTSTDANGHTTTYQYDALGRNISVTDPLTKTTNTYFDAAGQVISTTNALGKATYYKYDKLGRQISITDPNGSKTDQSYDAAGNLISTTDANDVVTHYEYDKLSHLTAVVENYKPGFSANNEINVRTEYTYDENGNRLSIKDANGHITTFAYDELNRVTEESDPLDHTWTFTYDSLGRKATVTDANNVTATYIYDDAGQLTGIDYPGTTSDVSFTYDSGGRRTQMIDALGTTTWDYDDLNRIISVTDPFTQTVEYDYDAAGNRTGLTYPDTKSVTYSYNSGNQLTNVTDWNDQVTQYSYDPVGRLLSLIRPNGVNTSYTYNDGGQLTQLQHAYQSSALATYQYNYDAKGNRTSVSENYKNPKTDAISDDQFESGDISGWNAASIDEGDLRVSSTAALEGNYGLEVLIDDTTELWVEDVYPSTESHYRARFYFDPNSIVMPTNSTMDLFYGIDVESETIIYIELRSIYDEYQIRISTLDDSDNWVNSYWFPISNDPHAIELEWQASSSSTSTDGQITFWIDGLEKSQISDMDNDTKRIDNIQLGVLNISSSLITGTVFFDDFASKRTSYIGLNSNIPIPEHPDLIFEDNWESGDFTNWSAVISNTSELSVTSNAAVDGNFGMQAVINDSYEQYIIDESPLDDEQYHVRFYFDPNSVNIPTGESFDIFKALNINTGEVFSLTLRPVDNEYQIRVEIKDDNEQIYDSSWNDISDNWHALEIGWQASSEPDVSDGHLKFWIDSEQCVDMGNLEVYSKRIDTIMVGVMAISELSITGTVSFDDFDSNRAGYIGWNPNIPHQGQIFADAFETYDFSNWTNVVSDTGDLSISDISPIEGNYFFKVIIDDANDLYIEDKNPIEESEYYARFYFDPNSVNLPTESSMDIFQAFDINSESIYTISIRPSPGNEYQFQLSALDDNDQFSSSLWIPITDETHSIEIEWQAASEPDANDGLTTLWIDGIQKDQISGIDNDEKSIDYIQMGVLSPSTSTITGTVFFDDFDSNNSGYIGLNSNIQAPEIPEVILSDAFESGDFSAWTDVITDSNDLVVTTAAAIESSYGLLANIDDQSDIYVIDSSPLGDASYHARFYFDPNSISIPSEEFVDLFQSLDMTSSIANYVRLRSVDGQYQIQAGAVDDNQQTYATSWFDTNDDYHAFEIDWQASSTPDANDGYLKLWIDGEDKANLSDLDIYTKRIDTIKLGALSISDPAISGNIFYDDFVSNRTGYIGLNPNIYQKYIFADTFESNDFSAWSNVITDSDDLTITGIAPIEGNYSLKAVIDDANDLWVEDNTPNQDYHYFARFYFDPYSVSIPTNEYINIFRGIDENSNTVLFLRLQELDECYQVQAVATDDNQETWESDWVPLHDGINIIEFEWYKSWDFSTNDGFLVLWTNDMNMGLIPYLDNDTKFIDSVELGVFSPTTTTISGTVFFDDFASNRDYFVGQNPKIALPYDSEIFADNFNTGDFARWDEAISGNGNLSVSTQAAILGNYGLQVMINDVEEMYLTDLNPNGSNQYFTLFYFDPNSVSIPSGETLNIYQVKNDTGATAITLQLRQVYDEYQVSASARDDSQQTTYTGWVALSDEAHAIELFWRTADEPEGNNGNLNLYVDDVEKWSIFPLDNDTIHVDIAQLGVISPTTNAISGTLFFDDFGSDNSSYIALNPNFTIPELPEGIFEDDFERGDFSAWSTVITDSGDLSVSSAASIEGDFIMQAVINDNDDIYVQDSLPYNEVSYHKRFYFDPNSVNLPADSSMEIFRAKDSNSEQIYAIKLHPSIGNEYQLQISVLDDNDQWINSLWIPITDETHAIEVAWQAASEPNTNNGNATIWLDGNQKDTLSDIDNDEKSIDSIQMGVLSPSTTTITGTVFFDDFDSNNSVFIGLNSNIPTPEIPSIIFSDAFEDGNFSTWTGVITDSNDLVVTTTAAIEGSYGMLANLNDQNAVNVIDSSPLGDASYHARFYFDPNSISIPSGEYIDILQSMDTASSIVSYVRLTSCEDADYPYMIQVGLTDDNNTSYTSSWFGIIDYYHAIEIEWQTSSGLDTNDGHIRLWIDGERKANIGNLDVYTKRIDTLMFGARSISDPSITGTIFFDDFDSNRSGYIGLNPAIPYSGQIFTDSFETGDFSAWSNVITDTGDLTITGIASIEGNYSLKAVVNDSNNIYIQDDNPLSNSNYHARFYFDPYSVKIPTGATINLFQGKDTNSNMAFYIQLHESNDHFQVKAIAMDDNQQNHESDWLTIHNGNNIIELEWNTASGSGVDDGYLNLWTNDVNFYQILTLDNDAIFIDSIEMGVISPTTTTITGVVFFDDFDSNRDNWIGQNPNVSLPSNSEIFADKFETGEFARWDETATGNGDLSVSTQTAILGNYGLNAVINDGQELYLTDLNPDGSNQYFTLFYFDPNSVSIPSGEMVNIYQVKDDTGATALSLQLRQVYGEYQIRSSGLDDSQQTNYTGWVALSDEAHAIELFWRTADEPGANNGNSSIAIDDVEKWAIYPLDNDTLRVDIAQLGIISPTTSAISGTIFFDDFGTDNSGYITLNPNFTIPELPYDIFEDDFESGDFSAWSTVITDSGDLIVTSTGVIQGNYGMQAAINDQNELYVYDESPLGSKYYHVRFFFDPNSVNIPENEYFDVFHANATTAGLAYRVRLRLVNGQYQMAAAIEDDNQQVQETGWYDINDAPVSIQLEYESAYYRDSYDGSIKLWLDNILQEEIFDLANFTKCVDNIQLGVMSPSTSTIAGTVYFDDLDSNRTGYIAYQPQNRFLASFDLRQWLHQASEFISGLFDFFRPEQAAQPSNDKAQTSPQSSETQMENHEVAQPAQLSSFSGKSVLANYMLPNPPQTTLSSPLATLQQQETISRTITYTYDPLSRLTAANYSNNTYYHYTYDAVGNRLSQVTNSSTITYTYDIANRLTHTNGATYTWDANGNLLSDGANTYTYDLANRLTAFNNGTNTTTYAYNGLGDRLQQTVNYTTTTYAVDIAGGLTQVLSDGTNTYLYGVNRINQQHASLTEYYLADALGSVRQLADSSGDVVLARSYDPYGNLVESNAYTGITTPYGYTGEYTDASGMVYLRARYYSPAQGRFVSRDVWEGEINNPITINQWAYANDNPSNLTDPTGLCASSDSLCMDKAKFLYQNYGWILKGEWLDYEIDVFIDAANEISSFFDRHGGNGKARMRGAMSLAYISTMSYMGDDFWHLGGGHHHVYKDIVYPLRGVSKESMIHEMGHILDNLAIPSKLSSIFGDGPSDEFAKSLGVNPNQCTLRFACEYYYSTALRAAKAEMPDNNYAYNGPSEDFAVTFENLVDNKTTAIDKTPHRSQWVTSYISLLSKTKDPFEVDPYLQPGPLPTLPVPYQRPCNFNIGNY